MTSNWFLGVLCVVVAVLAGFRIHTMSPDDALAWVGLHIALPGLMGFLGGHVVGRFA